MKTKLLLLSLMTSVFIVQAQDRNRVNAMNNEISDNLDLSLVILEIQEIGARKTHNKDTDNFLVTV
jgi:hypothetical protein